MALCTSAALSACGGGDGDPPERQRIELPFEARFGDQLFRCDLELPNLGLGRTTVSPLDFRMYVHGVELVRENGDRESLTLENDGVWQRDGVALLDFEDATGTCDTGSPELNRSLRGSAPAYDDYVKAAFTVGVPPGVNHLDAATASPPLNVPGMWWSWQGGYKYMRLDVASQANPGGFFFHLGGTNCEGSPTRGYACQYANLPRVEVELSSSGAIILDAGAVYSGVDLSLTPDMQTDIVPGCMGFAGDPECPPMFSALGLRFQDEPMVGDVPSMFGADDVGHAH